MSANGHPKLAFIGFGEAGQAMAEGFRSEGVSQIVAWDTLFPDAAGAALKDAAQKIGARVADSAADAVANADIVIAAVTAASSFEAAQSVAPHLQGNPLYLDVNSVSPGRKQETAKLLTGKAHYCDLAILSPIHPKKHKSPMLLAATGADAIAAALSALGMNIQIAGEAIGAAAAIKMVRSVMIKGIEALTLECFLAASRAGVFEEVAASLKNNYPSLDWNEIAQYNIERMASHGIRRAAEMEEVADTLRELGVAPLMTNATVARQREMGEIGKSAAVKSTLDQSGTAILDAISAAVKGRDKGQ